MRLLSLFSREPDDVASFFNGASKSVNFIYRIHVNSPLISEQVIWRATSQLELACAEFESAF
jgi:hypothetical protein